MEAKILNIVHKEILEWYAIYGRKELPWRNLKGENAPYGVYVSEIMLQQTQVSVVLGKYYNPFLNAFPTLEALSLANEDDVLLLWRGLGYYSRPKNMLKTAKICGKFLPDDPKELIKLPGIGAYTAGAIACFGFGKAVGFVDGNIRRILSRFFALVSPRANELQKYATIFLNQTNSFDHNQALLDIGSSICIPVSPKCGVCPLQGYCKGKENPIFYTHKSKIIYEALDWNLGVCIEEGRIALHKSNVASYQGLYNFPKIQNDGILDFPLIGTLKHSYTHYRLSLNIYLTPLKKDLEGEIEFFSPKEMAHLPISGMTLKILGLIEKKGIWMSCLQLHSNAQDCRL